MNELLGKTALVTGASRGIGRATAVALARAGALVLVHYGQAASEAEQVVAQIRQAGGRAIAFAIDLSEPYGAHQLASQTRDIIGDRLDILVANAGMAKAVTLEATTVKDFDRLYAVNVRAPFFLVQGLQPIIPRNGSIVLLSSLAGSAAMRGLPAYGATKGAIEAMVKHFAATLGPRGIRVNAVAPGIVDTEWSSFTKTEADRAYTLGKQALQRIAQADDVADVITFLASDQARWINGESVRVDGGSNL